MQQADSVLFNLRVVHFSDIGTGSVGQIQARCADRIGDGNTLHVQ